MPAPPSNPTVAGKKRRRWLLYAAGLGVLLALIVLIRKRSNATSEGEGAVVSAPANLGEGGAAGGGSSAGEQFGSELNAFRAELAAANAAQTAGFAGLEAGTAQSIAGLGSKLDAYYGQESPVSRREAEEAAYERGVAKVKSQEKASKPTHAPGTPAHKQSGKPAAKHPGKAAPKPHHSHAAHSKTAAQHTRASRRTPVVHHGHAPPRPHKKRR
jgi:hypothetical protein